MNYAEKLIEKKVKIVVGYLHDSFVDVIQVDDFRKAVLEKNKKIDKIEQTCGTRYRPYIREEQRKAEARAFRELVQACKDVGK